MKNIDLKEYVRTNIQNLAPYKCARNDNYEKQAILLNANENPFGNFNRYPDPWQTELKKVICKIKNIDISNLFLGNGSDEIIDIIYRVFATPNSDKVILCPPTYGMYEVYANINNIEVIKINLVENTSLDIDNILKTDAKLMFICSPNNPTGNNIEQIEFILQKFNGIVIIDEAYIDFSNKESYSKKINQYKNLIVLQTLSKAYGIAGLRIGIAFTNTQIIDLFNKVKPPYNISFINQKLARMSLEKFDFIKHNINELIKNRGFLENELSNFKIVKKIFKSNANFLLVEFDNPDLILHKLIDNNILIRDRTMDIPNCLRISIGSKYEINQLLKVLKTIENE